MQDTLHCVSIAEFQLQTGVDKYGIKPSHDEKPYDDNGNDKDNPPLIPAVSI